MIAITPRTGSTFLCAALHEAGHGYEPNEVFNPRGPAQMERAQRQTQDFPAYVASFARGGAEPFIFKTGWSDAAPLAPALTRIFPNLRVIYLDRKNIAAQAVSQFRAELSGQWHARHGQAKQEFDPAGRFDLTRISAIMSNMEREKQGWEGWFAANAISPMRLEYRQIETDVRAVLRHIAQTMALDLRPDMVSGGKVLKLADETSADWTERVQKHLFNLS